MYGYDRTKHPGKMEQADRRVVSGLDRVSIQERFKVQRSSSNVDPGTAHSGPRLPGSQLVARRKGAAARSTGQRGPASHRTACPIALAIGRTGRARRRRAITPGSSFARSTRPAGFSDEGISARATSAPLGICFLTVGDRQFLLLSVPRCRPLTGAPSRPWTAFVCHGASPSLALASAETKRVFGWRRPFASLVSAWSRLRHTACGGFARPSALQARQIWGGPARRGRRTVKRTRRGEAAVHVKRER